LQVPDACISLNFSPTGEFLVTAHVCNIGIFLWSNRTLYSHVSLKAISKDDIIPEVELPGSSAETNKIDEDDVVAVELDYVSPDQLDSDLITMSAIAQSKWKHLLDIDIIKMRNKPKQAPKVSENAPFFLPTISTLQSLRFDFSDVKATDSTESSRIHSTLESFTTFSKSLQSTAMTDNFSDVIEKLKEMGPSAIDFEIQSLSLNESSTELLLLQFMKMIHHMMEQQTNFELSQTYLAVFLKWHGEMILENKVLQNYLQNVQEVQMKNWLTLQKKLFYNLSIVETLKKM